MIINKERIKEFISLSETKAIDLFNISTLEEQCQMISALTDLHEMSMFSVILNSSSRPTPTEKEENTDINLVRNQLAEYRKFISDITIDVNNALYIDLSTNKWKKEYDELTLEQKEKFNLKAAYFNDKMKGV